MVYADWKIETYAGTETFSNKNLIYPVKQPLAGKVCQLAVAIRCKIKHQACTDLTPSGSTNLLRRRKCYLDLKCRWFGIYGQRERQQSISVTTSGTYTVPTKPSGCQSAFKFRNDSYSKRSTSYTDHNSNGSTTFAQAEVLL
jgi:hypothetical protein